MKCWECGEEMKVTTEYILCSEPPMFKVLCKCGNVDTVYCHDHLGCSEEEVDGLLFK